MTPPPRSRETPREKIRDVQSFDHKTKKRDREIRKKIGFPKKEKKNAQYLPGDRVVEILRLPGTGELDDAKKRRRREERSCCCCGSQRERVFGHFGSFCEEAFFVWQLERLFFLCIFTLTFLLLV